MEEDPATMATNAVKDMEMSKKKLEWIKVSQSYLRWPMSNCLWVGMETQQLAVLTSLLLGC